MGETENPFGASLDDSEDDGPFGGYAVDPLVFTHSTDAPETRTGPLILPPKPRVRPLPSHMFDAPTTEWQPEGEDEPEEDSPAKTAALSALERLFLFLTPILLMIGAVVLGLRFYHP